MPRYPVREAYEDVVLRTKPVLYVPMQGSTLRELVRQVAVTNTGAVKPISGPFPSAAGARFTASTADQDALTVATNVAYHPGDTFTIGGWINRLGAGDASGGGPVALHLGTGDVTVWFPTGTNAGRIVARKAGTGDFYASTATDWGTPYTKGWQHVMFTKATTTRAGYINGVADAGGGTTANQTIVAAATTVRFGISLDDATSDFDGALAHWAIWNRVLSASEVAELYRAGREGV